MVQGLSKIEIDSIPGMVLLINANGQVLYSSGQFLNETGYAAGDILGKSYRELRLFKSEKDENNFEKIVLCDNVAENVELQLVVKSGDVLETLMSSQKIRFGEEDAALCVWTDISSIKQKLRYSEENERSYHNIMEKSPIAIALVGASDARYVDVNEAWSQRAGFKREEVLGKTSPELNVYRDLNVRKKMWEEFTTKGYVDDLELAFTNRFGENLYSLVSARKIEFKGEECLLYISTKIDALKAAEKKLAEREENYRTILDMAPYSITITKQRDGVYLQVNKVFLQRTGYALEEVIGHTPQELNLYVSRHDRSNMMKILKRDGRIDSLEMPFRGKNGEISDNIISMTTFRFQGEECIISMAVDITERKKAETELAEYRQNLEHMVAERTQELEAAQKELVRKEKLAVLGQLTATVSHELRNPLGVIRSSNFFLQRKIKDREEKISKHFRRIDEQVSLCDTIVNDLLEYTRGRNVEAVIQSVSSWVPAVVDQIREQEQILIRLDMPEELSPVAHDPEKMQRVLINLLINAVQAVRDKLKVLSGENGAYDPDISVGVSRDTKFLLLSVCDNGIGMDEETRKKAFEPLFTTKARGTGIGLANVKKIVEDHGGSIEFESRPKDGTRISIFLPYD